MRGYRVVVAGGDQELDVGHEVVVAGGDQELSAGLLKLDVGHEVGLLDVTLPQVPHLATVVLAAGSLKAALLMLLDLDHLTLVMLGSRMLFVS